MVHLAQLLKKDGWQVASVAPKGMEGPNEQLEEADAALFPYPISVKEGVIPSTTDIKLSPEEVLKRLPADCILLAGKGLEEFVEQDSDRLKRYTEAVGFETENAEISAEAAIYEAMARSQLALLDTKVLVTGYGLFGRALAKKLKALGANVWIAARREEQRVLAAQDGMESIGIVEMDEVLPQMDLIFNTIPARIFGEYHLKQLPPHCWLLELASAPYGFDEKMAQASGVSYAVLPGLPGKYAPVSAALALRKAVNQLLARCPE